MAMQDGIIILRVVVALFENLLGQIDFEFENLIGILLAELKMAFDPATKASKKKEGKETPSNYISMILQTIATAFTYNASATFAIIEKNN